MNTAKPRIVPTRRRPAATAPAAQRRSRVLLVGCGDVGLRVAALLRGRVRLLALTSDPQRLAVLRSAGIRPILGNLDEPATLRRLAGLGQRVLHLAPPPALGRRDPRTRALLRALRRGRAPRTLVYGSTSGVYGDCQGQWVAETRAPNPESERAHRRWDAEHAMRTQAPSATRACVLRIPGIYAADRAGGTPVERLRRAQPVLLPSQDGFTNHIHADDLARACLLALWRGRPKRVYHVVDDGVWLMGDYMDAAADLYGLPRPPRLSRQQAQQALSPLTWSFMRESRRLSNRRMKQELGLRLRYPDVLDGLRAGLAQGQG